MAYGIIIIQFLKIFAEFLRDSSGIFYKSLAILAMIIGALNIKDYFVYKKGSFATEMPLFLRPKVRNVIKNGKIDFEGTEKTFSIPILIPSGSGVRRGR